MQSDKIKLSVVNRLIHASEISWKDTFQLGKQQGGFEKIPKSQFKTLPNIPQKFSKNQKIDVFRLQPESCGRVLGFIEDGVFYIIWIDKDFKIYKH
ncbi:MAG: hypothetical protein OXE99_07390 [Cellvibrionales bacterium]|nr:hypothetical protein [Cellvibrionales bacterium]